MLAHDYSAGSPIIICFPSKHPFNFLFYICPHAVSNMILASLYMREKFFRASHTMPLHGYIRQDLFGNTFWLVRAPRVEHVLNC